MIRTANKQKGFTIIELLVATTVFSVILLTLTFAVLQIGKQYYKGITSSRTQTVARSISDEVARAIQFSGGTINFSGNYMCTDTVRFTFQRNVKLQSSGGPHVFLSNKVAVCPGVYSFTGVLAPEEKELMGVNMRLLNFEVVSDATTGGTWRVTVKVASGDDDLIIDNAGRKANNGAFVPNEGHCANSTAGQFCAVSELVTNVQRRV